MAPAFTSSDAAIAEGRAEGDSGFNEAPGLHFTNEVLTLDGYVAKQKL